MKKTIRSCVRCRRMDAKPLEQFMGLLRRARLEAYHPPFTFTGVDLFGPLQSSGAAESRDDGDVCSRLTTRAVHLDATPSLETDDFIMILHQFIAEEDHLKRFGLTGALTL